MRTSTVAPYICSCAGALALAAACSGDDGSPQVDVGPLWTQSGSSASRHGQSRYRGPSADRKLLWTYVLDGGTGSDVAIGSDGTAYFTQHLEDQKSKLIAIGRDGNVKWRKEAEAYASGPVLGPEDTVHVVESEGGSHRLTTYHSSGDASWHYDLSHAVTTALVISESGQLYFGTGGPDHWRERESRLHAVGPSGDEIWSVTLTSSGYLSTPAISGDTVYIGGDKLRALDRNNGSVRWERPIQTLAGNYGPAVGPDGTIYLAETDWQPDTAKALCAVSPDGTAKWKIEAGFIEMTPAIASDGTVYFHAWPSADPSLVSSGLFAVRPDGRVKWSLEDFMLVDTSDPDVSSPLSGSDSSPVIGADGTIYLGADTGSLYAVSPEGTLLWEDPLGFELDNRPALDANGTLLICNAGGPGHTKCFALSDQGTLDVPKNPWDGWKGTGTDDD